MTPEVRAAKQLEQEEAAERAFHRTRYAKGQKRSKAVDTCIRLLGPLRREALTAGLR